jgi:LmbE family N-acetylglucosaminyl deacetylase
MTEVKRALAIGAHPDDAEFGAGGTLARMAREGWEVTYIVVTNGNKGTHDRDLSPFHLSAAREIEQKAALDVLGGKSCIHLRYNDGELEATAARTGTPFQLIEAHLEDRAAVEAAFAAHKPPRGGEPGRLGGGALFHREPSRFHPEQHGGFRPHP